MTVLSDYLERKYGFKIQEKEKTVTVGTTATKILEHNPNRILWKAINLGANTGYAAFDGQVSSSRGIVLDANGGYAGSDIEKDGQLSTKEVFGIQNTASGTWYVVEVLAR